GRAGMQALLPVALDLDDLGRRPIRSDALQDRELQVLLAASAQELVAAMSVLRVSLPAAEDIVRAVGRSDVTLSGLTVEDVVDAAPLAQRRLPARRQYRQLLPAQHQLLPRSEERRVGKDGSR